MKLKTPLSTGHLILGTLASPVALPADANGQISFEPTAYFPGDASGVATADFNNDARPDIALADGRSVQLMFNDGIGGFGKAIAIADTVWARGLVAGDVDGDGWTDLVWSNSADRGWIFYNDGNGTGEVIQIPDAQVTWPAVALADLDGNGQLDVVYGTGSGGRLEMLLHFGRGRFERHLLYEARGVWAEAQGLAFGDFDLDGDCDVAAAFATPFYNYYNGRYINERTQLVILSNDGGRGIDHRQTLNARLDGVVFPWSLAAGDIDGDGDVDLVIGATLISGWREYEDAVQAIYLNRGQNGFAEGPRQEVGPVACDTIRLVDVDGDGKLDIIWGFQRGYEETGLLIRRNLGSLKFEESQVFLYADGASLSTLHPADFDGDGRFDILSAVQLVGTYVLRNASPYDGPLLEHTPLQRGWRAIQRVHGAAPGSEVYFLYSVDGAGNSPGIRQLGGVTLDLQGRIGRLGHAVADADGVAEFHFTVPPDAPLAEVVLQAVIRRGPGGADSVKTPFRTAVIAR